MTIHRMTQTNIELSPTELAKEFCNLDADAQAIFFNAIARIVEFEWDHGYGSLVNQLHMVNKSPVLTSQARIVMQTIGEYGEVMKDEK